MSELVELRHAALRTLLSEVDGIVVPCLWAQDLLQLNGVPSDKLTLSRQGLAGRPLQAVTPRPQTNGPLRIAYLGRLHPTKGADLLIRAVRELPGMRIELHLFGVNQSADAYQRELCTLAGDDPRIQFLPPVPNDQVVQLLRVGYHALAVPSRCLETGPLVVLEAFAAGVPVVGACLGGIRELVRHEVDGLLVEPGSVSAWRQALARLAQDRDLVNRLERGMRPPRGMDAVADDMLSLYGRLAPAMRRVAAVL
jgi:glycosyltransferase involved in cell wall biosynthesis